LKHALLISQFAEAEVRNKIKELRPFIIILTILAGVFLILVRVNSNKDAAERVSGTIQAVEVAVSFEMGGQIAEVLVEEGDYVEAGDVLARLDDEVLHAQFKQAQADLAQAEANYQWIASRPLPEQRQVAISAAGLELLDAQRALQDLIENADLASANALQSVEDAEQMLEDTLASNIPQMMALEAIVIAEQAVDEAERDLKILTVPASQAVINQVYANLLLSEDALNTTLADIQKTEQKLQGGGNPFWPFMDISEFKKILRQSLKYLDVRLSQDQLSYKATQDNYNRLIDPPDPIELALTEAGLTTALAKLDQAHREYGRVEDGPSQADSAVLRARIEAAKREYEALQDGPDPADLALAQARVQSAEANLALAQADTIQEQLDVALAQIDSALAALNVVQTRLDKMVMTAPVDGVVLFRSVEPGEVVKPGTPAITLGLLEKLIVTIFLPEDRYDEINLGGEVWVTVQAYPDERFTATIIQIADETDFIPRNVQTDDGHSSNVFAAKLLISNSQGKLRPGMTADVLLGD